MRPLKDHAVAVALGKIYNEGLYTLSSYDSTNAKPNFFTFNKNYMDLFGSNPVPSAYFAYDTMKILYAALDAVGPKKTRVKDYILKYSKVESILEDFEIDEFGDATRQYAPMVIKNGELVPFPN